MLREIERAALGQCFGINRVLVRRSNSRPADAMIVRYGRNRGLPNGIVADKVDGRGLAFRRRLRV